jgi:hypothetical protein
MDIHVGKRIDRDENGGGKMIDFSKVQGVTIPEGVVTQIADENGVVLWSGTKLVRITITSDCNGIMGDTSRITVRSDEPFAPDPTNPRDTTQEWTAWCYDMPDCTFELLTGSTIECFVTRTKGNLESCVIVNGEEVVSGEGTYIYTVTRDVAVDVSDVYSMGEYGIITITE